MNRDQISTHLPSLRRYARVLTGDAWAADDLVQDTLERACRKWLLWRSGTDLRAWLFSIMHNLYLNQRRTLVPVQWVDLDAIATLEAPLQTLDDAHDLERCLQRLPADQRSVLLLVALEDLSYDDVARVLQIPIGTVMSRLSRARHRLKELMSASPVAAAAEVHSAAPSLRRLK